MASERLPANGVGGLREGRPGSVVSERLPANGVGGLREVRPGSVSLTGSYRDGLELAAAHVDEVEQQAREEDGREEAGYQTHEEGDREAFHRSRPEVVEDARGDQHGDVGVDDRAKGAGESGVDRGPGRLADADLLTDALEDQDVGVHRHTD